MPLNRNIAAALVFLCIGNISIAQNQEDSMVISRPSVSSGNRIVFEPDAYIELRYSQNPMAVAEIHFKNRLVNGPSDNGSYHLSLGEVEVELIFTWDPEGIDDDRIEVITGPSYWVHEPMLDVMEGSEAIILIYPALS